MKDILPLSLIELAENCPTPLYAVGGSVRDYYANLPSTTQDWDITSPLLAEDFVKIALAKGFLVKNVFKNTGTVKLVDKNGIPYEYTCFRSDEYVRGKHTPVAIYFTTDIQKDATRRDFTANAVYYDIKKGETVDPLDGLTAIKEKRLSTVVDAKKVFGEDGLRLLRLARQAGQLGFTPDEECLLGARDNALLIQDITPERIFSELSQLLVADKKHDVKNGHYHGLKILDETRVLDKILPELTLGRGMKQRSDFHSHDVLEHSLRTVLYAESEVRLAALLHDVGKPYCATTYGNAHAHPQEGERIAIDILTRLKAPKKTIEQTAQLVKYHMYDFDCKTGENKLRKFFVNNYTILKEILLVKQADFSACKDDLSVAPTCKKWAELFNKMQAEKTPFTLKDLAVSGKDMLEIGIKAENISSLLNELLLHACLHPNENNKERLKTLALSRI